MDLDVDTEALERGAFRVSDLGQRLEHVLTEVARTLGEVAQNTGNPELLRALSTCGNQMLTARRTLGLAVAVQSRHLMSAAAVYARTDEAMADAAEPT